MNIEYNSIKDIINTIRLQPGMYLGNNHLSSLRCFLDGYIFALSTHHIETEDAIPFWYFHEFVSQQYNWAESTAGWCHIILAENDKDEERALNVFFELFDQFSSIKICSVTEIKLSKQNIDFHYSDKCKTKRIVNLTSSEKEPIYKIPSHIYLFELSNNWFIYQVIDNGQKDWAGTIFHDKESTIKQIENLFGTIE